MLWIPITIAAAGFQTARTALQHRLRDVLAPSAAGFVRYVYGAPIALAAVAVVWVSGVSLPSVAPRFWPAIVAGGLAQIVGTVALLRRGPGAAWALPALFLGGSLLYLEHRYASDRLRYPAGPDALALAKAA